jgi:hypothetical protein
MKIPVVVIKVPLYDYNEEDVKRPFNEAEVEEALGWIKSKDDVAGFSIDSIAVEYEEDENAEE